MEKDTFHSNKSAFRDGKKAFRYIPVFFAGGGVYNRVISGGPAGVSVPDKNLQEMQVKEEIYEE